MRKGSDCDKDKRNISVFKNKEGLGLFENINIKMIFLS